MTYNLTGFQRWAPLIGRIYFALLFIPAGVKKAMGFDGTVGYIASAGLPMPQVAAVVAIVIEIGVAAALLVGWKARWAAIVLLLFTLVSALFFHQFWAAAPEQVMAQTNNFFKNIAIAGGLLFVYAFGAGPMSIDEKSARY